MTFPEFDEFFDTLITECRSMLDTKGKEYAHSANRFANFDRAAERKGVSRLTVASIFLDKHMDAIDSYIQAGREYSGENIRGRITDAITYLTLIAGMIEEPSAMQTKLYHTPQVVNTHNVCGKLEPTSQYICTLLPNHNGIHIAHENTDDPFAKKLVEWLAP